MFMRVLSAGTDQTQTCLVSSINEALLQMPSGLQTHETVGDLSPPVVGSGPLGSFPASENCNLPPEGLREESLRVDL